MLRISSSFAEKDDQSSEAAIGAQRASTSSISIVQGAGRVKYG